MSPADVRSIVRDELRRLALTAEQVSDLNMNDAGAASCKGLGNRDLFPDVAGQYGVYSRPLDGAEGVVLNLDGAGNFSILIGYRDRQYEMTLEKGEVALRDDQGQTVHLKRDGIYIDSPHNKIIVQGGTQGAVRVGDAVNATPAFSTWLQALVTAINSLGGVVLNFGAPHIADAAAGSSVMKVG